MTDMNIGRLADLRQWLGALDEAMAAEQVPDGTRRRVMNRLLYGDPGGPGTLHVLDRAQLAQLEGLGTTEEPKLLWRGDGSIGEAGPAPAPETE